jgi:hypothetical protein
LEQRLTGAVSTAPEATRDNPYILREGDGLKIGDTTLSFGAFIKAGLFYGVGLPALLVPELALKPGGVAH